MAARAQSEFRLTRMEDLYGSLPGDKAGQKDLEEVERRAGTIKGVTRGLPAVPPSLSGTSISDFNECEQCKFCEGFGRFLEKVFSGNSLFTFPYSLRTQMSLLLSIFNF